uniref:Uncharacterized protein n=1 Tax=Anguilla anguilla TaxID=7936 RepID=A0A0E9S0U6_ANGAN
MKKAPHKLLGLLFISQNPNQLVVKLWYTIHLKRFLTLEKNKCTHLKSCQIQQGFLRKDFSQ